MSKMATFLGFTLVELMVVITIIGVLSVVGYSKFSGVNKSADDLKKKADIEAIAKAYEVNFDPITNTYKPLTDKDFSTGKIPVPQTGSYFVTGPNVTAPTPTTVKNYSTCTKLGSFSGVCTVSNTNCYCKSSDQDVKPTATPTRTPTPTATPRATPTPVPGNLLANSSFENDLTGWSSCSGCSVNTTVGFIKSGLKSLKIMNPPSGTSLQSQQSGITVPSGVMRHCLSGWVYLHNQWGESVTTSQSTLRYEYSNINGNNTGSLNFVTQPSWQLLKTTISRFITGPADLKIYLQGKFSADPSATYFDDIVLTEGDCR